MSGGSPDNKPGGGSSAGEASPDEGPSGALPRKGLGVGLFWSILFMLSALFGLTGGMGWWMVRAASAQTEELAGSGPPG